MSTTHTSESERTGAHSSQDAAVGAVDKARQVLRSRIGDRTAPVSVEVERGTIRAYALATGETNPLYLDSQFAKASRFGKVVAPPTFVSYFIEDSIGKGRFAEVPHLETTLHTDDVVTIVRPIFEGDLITATACLLDVFERQGKRGTMLFQRVQMTLTNQHDELVATVEVVLVSF